jgi:DNA-directed RNA polymerase specialized sigma24 family protein
MDPQAVFERLYREFGPDVLAFCRRRVDSDVADEVTAETFLVVWSVSRTYLVHLAAGCSASPD